MKQSGLNLPEMVQRRRAEDHVESGGILKCHQVCHAIRDVPPRSLTLSDLDQGFADVNANDLLETLG